MKRLLYFLLIAAGFTSCSTFSGPQYNVAGPDNKANGGGYDEETYAEDISQFFMKIDYVHHDGTQAMKAVKRVENGITIVDIPYEFKRGERTFSFFMTITDYRGEGQYGLDLEHPAKIVFNKKKDFPEQVPDSNWLAFEGLIFDGTNGPNAIKSKGVNVKVTHADSKYIDVTFEGNFLISDASGGPIGYSYISGGNLRVQWQR